MNRWLYRIRVYCFGFGYYTMCISGLLNSETLLKHGFLLFTITALMLSFKGD